MSEDGLFVALSLAFDNNCGYSDTLSTLVKSPTMIRNSLQCLWVPTKPPAAATPTLRKCAIQFHRLLTLASPSSAPMLRLLRALKWLLIVAGDVELNPGPLPAEIEKLLPTVDASVLTVGDICDVLNEVESLAGRWEGMCIHLGLPPSDIEATAKKYHHDPPECLTGVLIKWVKMSYDTQNHDPPSWRALVAAVANRTGGNNPALAKQIANNHQGNVPISSNAVTEYAQHLQDRYQIDIPMFLTHQWPPPPTQTVLHLAMIRGKTIKHGPIDEDMVRLTLRGKVNDILYQKTPVELKDIFKMDSAKRKVILIEGAPGSGKSTLAWHICKRWGAGELFQNFRTVAFIQLRDPAIQSAKSVEDILPAETRNQAERVVAELKARRGQDLLFVMDGWDELPLHLHTKSIFQQLIASPMTLNLQYSTVIITSRPIASGDLYRYRAISSCIEILGFTMTEVNDYFTEALEGDSNAVKRLQDQLRERPMIEASCYLPINAAIVTHLFLTQNHSLPTTLHGVFTSLVLCCLIRHATKQEQKTQNISSLDNLPFDLQEPFKNICTVAYKGVMDNRAIFSPEHLEPLGLPKKLGTLGLIQGVESFASFNSSVSYHFLHLSVQELLASFYISQLPESKQVEVFKQLFGQPRFAMVFRFYAAFTKLGCGEIREIVGNIAKEKEKPQLLYLLLGLYEAQDVSLCQFVVFHLDGHLDLSSTALSPVDCLTVGYFTSCICYAGSGKFTAKLRNCSLDDYRVTYLTKVLCRSSSSGRLRTHNLATADTEVANSSELHLDLSSNQITAEGIQSIGEILKVNQSLRTLKLYQNQIGASGAAHIAEGLRQNNHLEILILAVNQIGASGAAHIAEGLRQNNHLEILSLGDNGIAVAGAAALAEALQHNNSLQELHLWENAIADDGAAALARVLNVNHSLKTLNLAVNQIGASGAAHIAEGLRQNNHLAILSLGDNGIADAGAAALAEALQHVNSLQELHLSWNAIADDGAAALAGALNVNHSLKTLNLQSNRITDVGARALGEALRVNQSLTELNLWQNAITDNRAAALAGALNVNHSLKTLTLSVNKITDVGARALGEALRVNQSLTTLDLGINQITDVGAKALGEALRVNQSLTTLDLGSNQITDVGARALGEALRVNQSLTTLGLQDNQRISSEIRTSLRKEFPRRVTFSFL